MTAHSAHISATAQVSNDARGRRLASPVLVALILLSLFCQGAEAQEPSEYAVKAAFLFHFAQLTNWPAEVLAEQAPITFCTLSKDPFHGEMEKVMANRSVRDHRINIVHLKEVASARTCNVLFVSAEQESQLPVITAALRGSAVLLTGESSHLLKSGAMIVFERQQDRLRFSMNTGTASRFGISFSSTLLSFASSIIKS